VRATIPRPNESSERGEIRASPAARSNKLSALPKGHSWSGKLRPVLVMHSEDDQIVPYVAAGPLSAKLLKNGTLKTYKAFPHGVPTTHADTINADLLAFLKA
jgi:pimeloyl-ACP methyl ester carboxylesterase